MFVIDGSGVMDAKVSEFMTPLKKTFSAETSPAKAAWIT